MRLADFISANIEPILIEWEAFARGIWPAGVQADPAELRDRAEEILHAAVADMAVLQSLHAQSEKAQGRGTRSAENQGLDDASQVHGAGRVGSGLTMPAVVAEYRALRASVLRLWRKSVPDADVNDVDDLTRFDEAIDQSLCLAVESFTRRLESGRRIFLGILAHDLRNPLSAISLTSQLASMTGCDPSQFPQQLEVIQASTQAMNELITQLINFSATATGAALPMTPAPCDLRAVCTEVVREVSAAHSGRTINCSHRGDLTGTWDAGRVRQMIGNLLGNALQHGSPVDPVDFVIDGTDPHTLVVTVHNTGQPIPAHLLPTIFDPLTQGEHSVQGRRKQGSVGLGLYIVREIAAAHGGSASLASSAAEGTTATIRLPRHARK